MNGAEYLEMVKHQSTLRQSCKDKIAQLNAEKDGLHSPSLDARVQTSTHHDNSDPLILIEAAIEEESAMLVTLLQMEAKARELISLVPDAEQQAVLRYRYLLHLPWKEVINVVHMTSSPVFKMAHDGLRYLENYEIRSKQEKKRDLPRDIIRIRK